MNLKINNMLLKLRINPSFKKKIYQLLTSSNNMKHVHFTIGDKLVINHLDIEEVDKILTRNLLNYKKI
jgi:hypothetical protein